MTDKELDALVARLRAHPDISLPIRPVERAAAADAIAQLRADLARQNEINDILGHERDAAMKSINVYKETSAFAIEERDKALADLAAARDESRMWMDRYSSLYVRVACGIAIGADEGSIFLEWQREVDAAYAIDPTASKDHD